ncbi:MAG: FAD-binding protein [Planctomycetaceae bacterium]|nr:FAD-binding protein [Planctomycetaceae bacterium]
MPRRLELRLPPGPDPAPPRGLERLRREAARRLGVAPGALGELRVERVSFDGRVRHRDWLVTLDVWAPGETPPPGPRIQPPELAPIPADAPAVAIVGSGPAGLFAALELVARGIRPLVFERGGDVRERRRPLAQLNRGEAVDPESNYCFGEGGAGTYSDGKLYARSAEKAGKRIVLETLVAHGAPPEILSSWRPHVGSNRLPEVVANLRRTILRAGGEVRFHARVEELCWEIDPDGARRVTGVTWRDLATPGAPLQNSAARAVVLATGHSARDSLELAARAGAKLVPKGFALGVRAEHHQDWLDEHQYAGMRATCDLPAAFYELVEQVDARGVYSFCMCPGGWIVPATTAEDRIVVNGMSLSRRNSPYANSGLVVQLEPEDWCGAAARANGIGELLGGAPGEPHLDPFAGVRVQEALERRAALAGGGRRRAPGQRIDRFLARSPDAGPANPTSYRPGVEPVDLWKLLPKGLAERLAEGLRAFDRRLGGFASDGGQLLVPESRTSSPVRIARDRTQLVAEAREGLAAIHGLYPAGEGAGYAGGIVSAALDGQRVARAIAESLADSERR